MTGEKPNEIIETARAVQATADTTKQAIGALEKTGAFLDRVFGGMVEDSVGIVADRIKFFRIKNFVALHDNTVTKLRNKGYDQDTITKIVLPKVGVPLIESATLEEDPALQVLWAQMLANAMDPKFAMDIKLRHVSLLREMEPLGVRILNACHQEKITSHDKVPLDKVLFERKVFAGNFGVTENLFEVSLLNLVRLSCIDPGFVPTSMSTTSVGGRSRSYSIYVGTESFTLTRLGAELCVAATRN